MILEILIAIVFCLLLFTISYALQASGLLHDVEVKAGKPPIDFSGHEIAYKLSKGPYNKSGHMFTELSGDIVRSDVEASKANLKTIGLFYDDPEVTQEDECRYAVGVVLDSKEPNLDLSKLRAGLVEREYLVTKLPYVDHVVYSSFPYFGPFSIYFAVKKVYPAIKSYILERNLCAKPAIEIYENDRIYFVFPLSKQDSFYLFDEDECSDDDSGSEYTGSESNPSRSDSECKTNVNSSAKNSPINGSRARKSKTGSHSRSRTTTAHDSPTVVEPEVQQSSKRGSTSSFEEISANEVH
ncbi:putative testis-expressed protein [Halotydeus destructor]|nr:putative testis-expressed protein [Halotydeus destructor]